MKDGTKSLIRHTLTALGVLLAAIGLGDISDLFNTLVLDLDKIWDAVMVIIGLVTTVAGFFTGRKPKEVTDK